MSFILFPSDFNLVAAPPPTEYCVYQSQPRVHPTCVFKTVCRLAPPLSFYSCTTDPCDRMSLLASCGRRGLINSKTTSASVVKSNFDDIQESKKWHHVVLISHHLATEGERKTAGDVQEALAGELHKGHVKLLSLHHALLPRFLLSILPRSPVSLTSFWHCAPSRSLSLSLFLPCAHFSFCLLLSDPPFPLLACQHLVSW